MNYFMFSGLVDEDRIDTDSEILVSVNGTLYRAYQQGDNGFFLYLKKAAFTEASAEVQVYVTKGSRQIQVLNTQVDLPQQ